MKRYASTYNGQDSSAEEQFRLLTEALTGQLVVPVHYSAPLRPRQGRIVVADGVSWNPIAAGVPRLVWFNGTTWVALNA